jgi:hypothetical protein
MLRVLEAVSRAPTPRPAGGPVPLVRADHACRLILARLGMGDDGALLRSLPERARGADADGGDRALRSAADRLSEAVDMLLSFCETLAGPLMGVPTAEAAPIASPVLVPRMVFPDLVAASRRWHADGDRFLNALDPVPDDAAWPALFRDADLPGGIRALCVTTPAALVAEGGSGPDAEGVRGLAHCVGGYARRCLAGGTHVVSLRAPDGSRLSTVELHAGGPFPVRIAQHRGAANGEPPARALAAAEALLDGLRTGAVPMDAPALAFRGPMPEAPWTPDAAMRAMEAWAPHLPPSLRTPDTLLEALRSRAAGEGTEPNCRA